MKTINFILILLFLSLCINSQTEEKRKSLFFELGGSGGLGSLNFEKSFKKKEKYELAWRLGFSVAPIDRNAGTGLVFPIMVHCMFGKSAHKLELGIGQGITITTKGSFFALTTLAAGYRYQHPEKKWFYRITYTPLVSYLVNLQMQQWAGASIGYTFKQKSK